MAMRCRWPPERDPPLSPTRASRPPGIASTKSRARAAFSAARISSSVARTPYATLARTVSSKSTTSWGTTAMERRSDRRVTWRRSTPSQVIRPAAGSATRERRLAMVLFPPPDAPTRATTSPRRKVRSTRSTTVRSP